MHAAFISYAREDEGIAAALQSALIEMARASPTAGQEQRLRVFRDVTNLVPGPALPDSLRRELAASEKLVILASPNAVRSGWVALELQSFLETRSADDVVVVLVGGTLAWDDQRRIYSPVEGNAFPDLGRSVFAAEPIHLDLRAAAESKRPPTLRDDSFRNDVASLLVAIVGGRKDDVVGHYVETYRQQRAELSFNLGFRGAIGFAVAVLLTAVLLRVLQQTLADTDVRLFHPRLSIALIIAVCVPIPGLGALACRLGMRGYLASMAALTLAVPFFAAGTLRAFGDSKFDEIGLAAASLVGFGLAGLAFSRLAPAFTAKRVVAAFASGSLLASLLFLLFNGLRQGETDFQIFAFPWFIERLSLVVRSLPIVAESLACWAAAIACAAVIGAQLGIARAQVELPALMSAPSRSVLQRHRRGVQLAASSVAVAALLLVLYARSPWHQKGALAKELDPSALKEKLGGGHWLGSTARLVRFGFQVRDALARAGRQLSAQSMSALTHEWIGNYLARVDDRSIEDPGLPEVLYAHAGESEPLLRRALRDAKGTPDRLALLSRVARRMGATGVADTALNRALAGLSPSSTADMRGQVAVALAEARRVEEATALLEASGMAITLDGVPCNQDFANLLWVTGVWKRLPEPVRREWSCNSGVAVAMAHDRRWDEAMAVLDSSRHLLGFWDTSILAVTSAAADQGRFDLAQRAAVLLRTPDNRRRYSESQFAIAERAFSRRDKRAFAAADSNLQALLSDEGQTVNDRAIVQLEYWRLLYLAGRHDEADQTLRAMSPSVEAAEALVSQAAAEMKDQHTTSAERSLARAWKILHLSGGRLDPPCETLGRISALILSMNQRVNARTIASECRPWRFEHYWLERYVALAGVLDAYTR